MALIRFAMPHTAADKNLARDSYSHAMAQGFRGDEVWTAAAAFYNRGKGAEIEKMRDTQRPSSLDYSPAAIDRATFKQYWQGLSAATVLPRAGAVGALFPPAAAAGKPKLVASELTLLSDNKIRAACRERGVTCSNSTQKPELMQRLFHAGWFLPEGGG